MSKYNYHLTGQNSDFTKIMAKIAHYWPHSDISPQSFNAKREATYPRGVLRNSTTLVQWMWLSWLASFHLVATVHHSCLLNNVWWGSCEDVLFVIEAPSDDWRLRWSSSPNSKSSPAAPNLLIKVSHECFTFLSARSNFRLATIPSKYFAEMESHNTEKVFSMRCQSFETRSRRAFCDTVTIYI